MRECNGQINVLNVTNKEANITIKTYSTGITLWCLKNNINVYQIIHYVCHSDDLH